MLFLQLCFFWKNIWKASRCFGFLENIQEACNVQVLKGEEMAISSWVGSLLYATSYLLFKALFSTGLTWKSRPSRSSIFCIARSVAFQTAFFFFFFKETAIFAELHCNRACSLLNNSEYFVQSLSGVNFGQLSQNITKLFVTSSLNSFVSLSRTSKDSNMST